MNFRKEKGASKHIFPEDERKNHKRVSSFEVFRRARKALVFLGILTQEKKTVVEDLVHKRTR